MVDGPATVLGGLPVIADCWYSGPDYFGEYDCGCDGLFWAKRDGKRGKPLSDTLMEKIEKRDPYWQANVTEQVSDYLSYSKDSDA